MSTSGRSQQTKTANSGLNGITNSQGLENTANNVANNSINLSGGLSPDMSKALANESGQINKAYSGAAESAQRGLSQRGMGVAPSGMNASIQNSAINNRGQAQTGAIGNAFQEQQNLNLNALNPSINAQNAGNAAIGASTGANTALSQMPTTAGNIMSGLSGLSGIGKNVTNTVTNPQGYTS